MTTLKLIFRELYANIGKLRFYSAFISVTLVSIFLSLEPLFFGKVISELERFYEVGFFDTASIIRLTAFWGLFVFFGQIVKYIVWQELTTRPILMNYSKTIKQYAQSTLDMSLGNYLSKNIGSIYKLIDRGTENQIFFLFSFFERYLFSVVSVIFIIFLLFFIHIPMALISLSLTPLMIAIGLFFAKFNNKRQTELSNKWDEIFNLVGNAMSNFALFKILSLEARFNNSINTKVESLYKKQMQLNKYWNISEIYTVTFVMITRILVLVSGIFFIQAGSLTLAELFVIFSYIGWIFFPLGALISELRTSLKQFVEIQKMYDELGNLESDVAHEGGEELERVRGNIAFQSVNFGYTGGKSILRNLNLSIASGQKIALVGNTGAGKSTIVNLLLRFWDVSSGEIRIDGVNIESLKKSSLRSHIGVVSQDNSLFNLSIEENLLFAKPDASQEEIELALKNAQADFVFELKDGIKTVIGERGLKLSGGEKQRISIARLFLKNPEILILDEATSALDTATEKKIDIALRKLMKGKTSIIIAHRLSTIQHADVIYVLEKGKIIESGSYSELIEHDGKFASLANPNKLILG